MRRDAAVVIIGGGIFGCSIAYHLARKGQRDVVVLEKNAIAAGTTPMAAGLVPQLRATETLTRAITYSLELFEHFTEATGCSAGFQQVGSLKIAFTEARVKDMEDQVTLGKQLGIAVDFISREQAQELVPTLHTPGIKAITFAPRDGYVNPHLTAVGLATAAHRLGVTLQTHTRVTGITLGSEGTHQVHTAAGDIRAPVIVDAAGAWTRVLGQAVGLTIPLVPVRHQYYVTAPLPGVRANQPVLRFVDCNCYVRHEAGGLLVGGFEANPLSFDMGELPPTFEVKDVPADMAPLRAFTGKLRPYLPILEDAFVVAERRGLPTMTPDGNFLLGDIPQVPGLYVAAGCCVTGISAAPVLGKLLAELIVDGQTSLDIRAMHINRFGGAYQDAAALRRACEEVYGHYYAIGWGKI